MQIQASPIVTARRNKKYPPSKKNNNSKPVAALLARICHDGAAFLHRVGPLLCTTLLLFSSIPSTDHQDVCLEEGSKNCFVAPTTVDSVHRKRWYEMETVQPFRHYHHHRRSHSNTDTTHRPSASLHPSGILTTTTTAPLATPNSNMAIPMIHHQQQQLHGPRNMPLTAPSTPLGGGAALLGRAQLSPAHAPTAAPGHAAGITTAAGTTPSLSLYQLEYTLLPLLLLNDNDKNDIGGGETTSQQKKKERSWVYREAVAGSIAVAAPPPQHERRLCKFHNLSNRTLHLLLQQSATEEEEQRQQQKQQQPPHLQLVKTYKPMTAAAVSCEVGQHFLFLDTGRPAAPTAEWRVRHERHPRPAHFENHEDDDDDDGSDPQAEQESGSLFYYDAYQRGAAASPHGETLLDLDASAQRRYDLFQKTLAYDGFYRRATGRSFLSRHGRAPPAHHLWSADYVGQEHVVDVRPPGERQRLAAGPADRRTLRVASTAPRVLVIPHFLSGVEARAVVRMAEESDSWQASMTGSTEAPRERSPLGPAAPARTSQTAWISRTSSPMIRQVYRRAARILRLPSSGDAASNEEVDAAILRATEDLQVVHYQEGQEYKEHYDFGFPPVDHPHQPTRFATLLIYLNDASEDQEVLREGGETMFPRRSPEPNATDRGSSLSSSSWTHPTPLSVTPSVGTAVLFYNMLPDGNMDDRSLHAALPVVRGAKWVCNIWIWDPFFEEGLV